MDGQPEEESALRPRLDYPFEAPPGSGSTLEVAPGVHWIRMPLPFKPLNHINLWAIDDGDGWALVDTGLRNEATADAWRQLLAGPLGQFHAGQVPLGEEVVVVRQLEHLLVRHLGQPPLGEAERGTPQPGHRLQVFLPALVVHIDALAAGHQRATGLAVRGDVGLLVHQVGDVAGVDGVGGKACGHGGLLRRGARSFRRPAHCRKPPDQARCDKPHSAANSGPAAPCPGVAAPTGGTRFRGAVPPGRRPLQIAAIRQGTIGTVPNFVLYLRLQGILPERSRVLGLEGQP